MPSYKPWVMFFCIALAALIAEGAVVLAICYSDDYFTGICLHIATIALIAAWAINARRRYNDRMTFILLPLTAAAGIFGVGIGFVAAIVYLHSAGDAEDPSVWIDNLFERNADRETDHIHERITMGLDDFESTAGVEPFRDILSGGSVLQKQMAIAKIARYFRPAFAPLLLQAANDPNAAVRVQAATALAKIERDFMARYIRLENDLRDLADNDPAKLKLAQLYDDYAHADLLDENNRQSLREKAIRIYEASLAQNDNRPVRINLARLYLRVNNPEKTCELLKPLIDSADVPRGAMLWYMEALFKLKKFGELRQLAAVQAPIIRISSDPTIGEFEKLPSVWEGTAIWEGKTAGASS